MRRARGRARRLNRGAYATSPATFLAAERVKRIVMVTRRRAKEEARVLDGAIPFLLGNFQ